MDINTKKKQTSVATVRIKPYEVDKMLCALKVPTEFSRKTRHLRDGMKAEEYRNLSLFFYPVLVARIETKGIRTIWLRFCYLMRLYCASEVEFLQTDSRHRIEIAQDLIKGIFHHYGSVVGTYNLHGLLHLEEIRRHGPLPLTSAIPFEGSFSHVRKAFRPGTPSIPKQIVSEMYVR